MLAYAFRVLRQTNYEEIASEDFEYIHDLFAAILAKGIAQQLKQGLYREYVAKNEKLSVMRGKLDIHGTIGNKIRNTHSLTCEYDELTENNTFNQILKTTASILMREPSVKAKRRSELKKIMPFFSDIDEIEPKKIRWNTLRYQRNNSNYQMLMNVCYFVLDGMLQTTDKGTYKMAAFSDDHMEKLYERFVLEYYRQHHKYLTEVKAARITWNLDEEPEEPMKNWLPMMQTDIMLRYNEKTLIIDTKYYGHTMQKRFNKYTIHSDNLYQIFAYVKNMDTAQTGNVSGMLLYAKTQESIVPDCVFSMSGNRISVKTLDLNRPFSGIAAQLDKVAAEHFQMDGKEL